MAIKIHDWNAEKAITLQPGEENAAILSFRIANVQGLEYFVEGFDSIKKKLANKENFNGIDFALILSHSAWYIYKALKEAKTKQTV